MSRYMIPSEFVGVCQSAGLFCDTFREHDANIAFAQSMMIQVDELQQQRHIQMSFLEFLEGIARVAEAVSLPPYDSNVERGCDV